MSYIKEWKSSELYPNYEVSNEAQVRRKDNGRRVTVKTQNGTQYVYVENKYGDKNNIKLDEIVGEAFLVGNHDDCKILHKDGNKYNHNPDNLEWTPKRKLTLKEKYEFVKIRCVETGVVHDSINEYCILNGLKPSKLLKCIELSLSTGGFHFEWAD